MLQKLLPWRPIVSAVRKWNVLETRFAVAVKLERRPVAVTYLDSAPGGVEKFEGRAFGLQLLATRGGWQNILYRSRRSF
jgi:hypothetical protein